MFLYLLFLFIDDTETVFILTFAPPTSATNMHTNKMLVSSFALKQFSSSSHSVTFIIMRNFTWMRVGRWCVVFTILNVLWLFGFIKTIWVDPCERDTNILNCPPFSMIDIGSQFGEQQQKQQQHVAFNQKSMTLSPNATDFVIELYCQLVGSFKSLCIMTTKILNQKLVETREKNALPIWLIWFENITLQIVISFWLDMGTPFFTYRPCLNSWLEWVWISFFEYAYQQHHIGNVFTFYCIPILMEFDVVI